MKPFRLIKLIVSLLLACTLVAQQSELSNHSATAVKSTFLVIYKPGPAWLPGKPVTQQPLREHGRYMLDLYSQGQLKIAGPFSDDSGGAVVLYAADQGDAKNIVIKDPAVVTGIFTYELHPWSLVDWESRLKSKQRPSDQSR
jgi:uncharacterized protein YciI